MPFCERRPFPTCVNASFVDQRAVDKDNRPVIFVARSLAKNLTKMGLPHIDPRLAGC